MVEVGLRGQVAQRADIVENPETAAVRAHYQVVVVHHQIADRSGRHVQAQRLPIVAIVEADEDGQFGGGEQQALAHRVFADRIDRAVGQAAHRLCPRGAAIVGAIDVRLQVVQAKAIDSGVRRVVVEVRSVELRHLTPGSHGLRGDVFPRLAAIAREVDQAIVGARPE